MQSRIALRGFRQVGARLFVAASLALCGVLTSCQNAGTGESASPMDTIGSMIQGGKIDPNVLVQGTADQGIKQLGESLEAGSPLLLDQKSAFAEAAAPANFAPSELRVSEPEDFTRPLPPGDYGMKVRAFCTQFSIHAPGRGLPYKLARMQGTQAGAIGAVLGRGLMAGEERSSLNATAWRIQSGLPLSQWPPDSKAQADKLIPDYEDALEGDFIQKAQSKYDSLKALYPGLPSFDQAVGATGGPGVALLTLRSARQTLSDKTVNAERLPDMLYQPTDGLPRVLPPDPNGSPSEWSEVAPGVVARFTVQEGNLGNNLLEFRVTAQDGKTATVNDILGGGDPTAKSASPGDQPALITYPVGRGAQALVPRPEPTAASNRYADEGPDAEEWTLVQTIESPASSLAPSKIELNAGDKIMIESSSDALPPTNQFYINVSARPLNANGSVAESVATPEWMSQFLKPIEYSSGFTGQKLVPGEYFSHQYVLQAIQPGPGQQWTVEIPLQAPAHGNFSFDRVKIYVPKK